MIAFILELIFSAFMTLGCDTNECAAANAINALVTAPAVAIISMAKRRPVDDSDHQED